MGIKKRNPLFKSHSPSYDGKGKHTEAGISKPQGREGARMESVLLAVALLGFGIGGYFVVGASRVSLP